MRRAAVGLRYRRRQRLLFVIDIVAFGNYRRGLLLHVNLVLFGLDLGLESPGEISHVPRPLQPHHHVLLACREPR